MAEKSLSERISGLVDSALDEMRSDVERRLATHREQLESVLQEETKLREDAALAAAADEQQEEGSALQQLLESARTLEASSSQAECLEALLDCSAQLASRVVFLRLAGDTLEGWSGRGFDSSREEMRRVSLHLNAEWDLARSGGLVTLEPGSCAPLASRLEAAIPGRGVLVPFLLQGRLAGALYADQLESGDPLDVESLALLTYMAARVVETQPLRSGPALAALTPAAAGTEKLEPWRPPKGSTADADATVREPAPAPAAAPPTEELPEASDAAATLPDSSASEEAAIAEAETEASQPEAIALEESTASAAETAELETAEALPEEPPTDETAAEPTETETEEGELETVETHTESVEPEPDEARDTLLERELPVQEADEAGTTAEQDESHDRVDSATAASIGPVGLVDPEEVSDAEAGTETAADQDGGGAIEVRPPEDLEGPGWAFSQSQARDEDREVLQSEARRLARLLVSEIKLYHEDEVWEGRKQGNIYQLLQDEIDRSREIFENRVDEDIRGDRDYFQEELVRQLADGDAVALGMR